MEHLDVIAAAGRQRVFRARRKITQPGVVSHVTQRAAGKGSLFVEPGDYLSFLGQFKEAALKFNLDVLAFCLMPNHVHMLLRPREKNLDRVMHALFSRYALWFNRKYQRRGHLFGGAYRQAVCLDPAYLLGASVYIHLNPVRAGLSEAPQSYRWSSYGLYDGGVPKESFVDPVPVLELLDTNDTAAREHYRRLMSKGAGVESDNALERTGVVERFCVLLSRLCPDLLGARKGNRAVPGCDVVELEKMIEDFKSSPARRNPQTRKARRYLVEQLMARGFNQQEIADRLGVTRKTVYNILRG